MSYIQVKDLCFTYEGAAQPVFDHVNFEIDTDWKLGIIGRNGRGKTTLLQLLMGKYPYQGQISAAVDFSYFPYPIADPGQNVWDIVTTICPQALSWQMEREISLLGVPTAVLERPFAALSNGEQTKVLLAALFLNDHRYLLIDEPTNHLDMPARMLVSAYLKRKPGFILVSHDRSFLDGCIDHVLSINRTTIDVQRGNFSTWRQSNLRREQAELAQNKKLQKEITRLDQAAKQSSSWSDAIEKSKKGTRVAGLRPDRGYIGRKSAKMMKRAKSIEQRRARSLAQKGRLLHDREKADTLVLSPLPFHARQLATLRDVSISYGAGVCLPPVSLTIETGERIALTGANGCGKSSILKLLAGYSLSYQGSAILPDGLRISYVPQDSYDLQGALDDFIRNAGLDASLFLAILRKLDFSRSQFDKRLETFSSGQKKKVYLAKSLCEKAHLYLWDEPLNFVDVLSRIQIETLLTTYRPTMLFVEHDRTFVEQIATRTLQL